MRIPMDVEELNEKQKKKINDQICDRLKDYPEYLPLLVEWLDTCDDDDIFGTEGWKHLFGFED